MKRKFLLLRLIFQITDVLFVLGYIFFFSIFFGIIPGFIYFFPALQFVMILSSILFIVLGMISAQFRHLRRGYYRLIQWKGEAISVKDIYPHWEKISNEVIFEHTDIKKITLHSYEGYHHLVVKALNFKFSPEKRIFLDFFVERGYFTKADYLESSNRKKKTVLFIRSKSE